MPSIRKLVAEVQRTEWTVRWVHQWHDDFVPPQRSQHRNQHTVQRAYLKRFANRQGKLWRYDKQTGLITDVAASRATVETDFYTLPVKGGGETLAWETEVLGRAELVAAKSFERILDASENPVSSDDRRNIAMWMAMALMRTTRFRDATAKVVTMRLERRFMQPSTPKSLRGRAPEIVSRNPHIVKNFHLLGLRDGLLDVTREIYRRGWGIVRFEDRQLLTSDNPVVGSQDSHSKPRGWEEDPIFVLPLSPQTGLIVSGADVEDYAVPPTNDVARWFNRIVVESAHRFVYHNADDPKQRYFPQLTSEERKARFQPPI